MQLRIDLSGECWLRIALHTHSGACQYWIGLYDVAVCSNRNLPTLCFMTGELYDRYAFLETVLSQDFVFQPRQTRPVWYHLCFVCTPSFRNGVPSYQDCLHTESVRGISC